MDKDKMFSIGEISNIFDIPIPTLRYYDEIELLKPACIDVQSNYRYYSLEQFKSISLIRYLKKSNVPLSEIKKTMAEMSPENYVKLLIRQKDRMAKELEKLEYILNKFTNRINEIKQSIDIENFENVIIKFIPSRKVIYHEERITCRPELERSIRKLESKLGYIVDIVSLTMTYDDLINKNYNVNNSIFVLYNNINLEIKDQIESKIIKEGYYACIYCKELQKDSEKNYNEILNYIKNNGYQLAKEESIRKVIIDSSIVENEKNYLAEIQIPIIK